MPQLISRAVHLLYENEEDLDGQERYCIHFIEFNKLLDEWVTQDRLDLTNMILPRKDLTPGHSNLKSLNSFKNGSRPVSPDRDLVSSS